MREEQYKMVTQFCTATKSRTNTITALHDVLPMIMIVFYPLQLLCLFINDGFTSEAFLKVLIVPLVVLIAVTLTRYLINAKRPYEVYDYTPVVPKNTKGKSFPSRHTASAFIIAMAFMYLKVELGIIMLVIATVIGITRVVSGAHFIRDVIGGAVIGIICGLLGFYLI